MTERHNILGGIALVCALSACGSRPSYWDTGVSGTASSYGLNNGVALVDDPDHRVVMLTAQADQQLTTLSRPIGHNVASTSTSPDGSHLFVLSTGDWPRRTTSDEKPTLSVIDESGFDAVLTQYTMTVPLPSLAIDPMGNWAVAYAGAGAPSTFVENPNEIVIFDLKTQPQPTPVSRTLRSMGSSPQRLTFTPVLQLPSGAQLRLLIIETDIDVTLLELGNMVPEVTVPLTSGSNGQQVQPASVVVEGFDPTYPNDPPRIAVRAVNNRNVFTFTLGPSDMYDFTPIINVIDVGGVATDIAFVRADMGVLRVAALVPTTSSAMLVDPDTGITTQVTLPAAYQRISLITKVVASDPGTDVAMLWNAANGGASGVAFWLLGNTVGQPYFSIQPIAVSQVVQAVDDVSGQDQLKVLQTSANTGASSAGDFFVLNLVQRTASPLQTRSQATLSIAPDGGRLWAFARGGTDLAKIDFNTLNPVPLVTDTPIDAVYDVARPPKVGGRSLIAIHNQGTMGATVFDANNPDK